MIDFLIAWSIFTTMLGLMAVAGWLACEERQKENR